MRAIFPVVAVYGGSVTVTVPLARRTDSTSTQPCWALWSAAGCAGRAPLPLYEPPAMRSQIPVPSQNRPSSS
jgi:hypothetical protein